MRNVAFFAAIAALAAALGGCAFRTRTRFDPFGDVDVAAPRVPVVASAAHVKVFYGTSPAGFSLRDNELTVEPGFHHRILGRVLVVYDKGACDVGTFRRKEVLDQLRAAAHQNGGNAVIYAVSAVSENSDGVHRCSEITDANDIGSGWAVVLEPPPPDPAPTSTPPAAQPPTAP